MSISHHAQSAWADLADIYGARWLRERGKVPTAAWAALLDSCKGEALPKVLDLVRAKHSTHPVTQEDFRKLARSIVELHVDADRIRAWWYSIALCGVERDGSLRMFEGEALWPVGSHLERRTEMDSRLLRGSLAVDARAIVARLASKYAELELAGGERSPLQVKLHAEALEELQQLVRLGSAA